MARSRTYFWLNGQRRAVGDIVEPGNWGCVVLGTPSHRWRQMEEQFEQVRRELNPQAPSRLACSFVFDQLETAELLRTKRPDDHLYEVALVDDATIYRTDMAWVHPELERWNAQLGNPRLYWSVGPDTHLQWPEVLTMSRLEVLRPVTP